MATVLTQDTKFFRKFSVTGTGILGDNSHRVFMEGRLKLTFRGTTSDTLVTVRGMIQNDTVWEDLGTIEVGQTTTLDISTWDLVQFECTNYAGTGGMLYVSGFITDFLDESLTVEGQYDKEIRREAAANVNLVTYQMLGLDLTNVVLTDSDEVVTDENGKLVTWE